MNKRDTDRDFDQMEMTLVALLVRGETVEAAARIAGVSERTVYRRKESPEFKAKLVEFRANMFNSVAAHLLEVFPHATDTLQALMNHDDPNVQHKSAVKLIDYAFKIREIDERDRRVKKMEVIVCGSKASGQETHDPLALPENRDEVDTREISEGESEQVAIPLPNTQEEEKYAFSPQI